MPALRRGLGALALGLAGGPAALAAQIDYRNLEDHRPTRVEDAYPIERYGFELSLPYVFTAAPGGVRSHGLSPELEYGFARGAAAGVRLDLLAHREPGVRDAGVASAGAFLLLNLVRELPALPALSLRLDAGAPLEDLGGSGGRVALGLLATRSVGRNRLHANAAWTVAAPERAAAGEIVPCWWAGVALDHTLFR